MGKGDLFRRLSRASIEREVEDAYNEGIAFYFPNCDIGHPYACDGCIETTLDGSRMLKLVIEYKFDTSLSSRMDRAKVLAQVVYYMKRFEEDGSPVPNVVFVGDRNECFTLGSEPLVKFLSEKVDWTVAPSVAAEKNPGMVLRIAEDDRINPFVFDVDEGFDFGAVVDRIKACADGVPRYVRLTERNFRNVFEYFKKRVLKGKVAGRDAAVAFLGVVTDPDRYYVHPSKKNTLVTPSGQMPIDGAGFAAFFSYFQRDYSPSEKTSFTAIADRLVEDDDRRRHGDFYTPPEFADYSQRLISEWLGEGWRDEYVVWDCCCGTKNLTRDHRFRELYSSTLLQSDLNMSERYNREGTAFRFDFLNGSGMGLPEGLRMALDEGRKLLFYFNPPYATSCNGESADGTSKAGIAKNTRIAKKMRDDGFGGVAEALHAQFLYRITKFAEHATKSGYGGSMKMAVFCNPVFLTGPKYRKFREWFNSIWGFHGGILFNASHFDDCSEKWGITFNMWGARKNESARPNSFEHTLVDKNEIFDVVPVGKKTLYSTDGLVSLSDYVRYPVKDEKSTDRPNLSSGIVVKDSDSVRGMSFNGAFGYFLNNANSVRKNAQMVGLFTSPASVGNGCGVDGRNFFRCTVAFAARRLVEDNWVNHMDEYLAPDEGSPLYERFKLDSVVYSLFDSKSQQSSLRGVDYHGRKWDIRNEFFWMKRDWMLHLADEHGNDATYEDAKTDSERFVAKLLSDRWDELSEDAQDVFNAATDLVRESFRYRALFDESHPEFQINNWDCGWYQVKALLKEFMPKGLESFRERYRAFAKRLLPQVYELGMLKK